MIPHFENQQEVLDLGASSRLYAHVMRMDSLQIGQVAQRTGLSVDAIRFYEKAGLLTRPNRSGGGYRLYDVTVIADLECIQRAQQLGFSLKEIRVLFSLQRHPHDVCAHVQDLIEQKLTLVRTKIAELQRLEGQLVGALRQCRTALQETVKRSDSCPVLAEITNLEGRGHDR